MSRRALCARIDAALEALTQATHLHIVATIKVHDRRAVLDGTKCPCCGSVDAEIVRELPAADLIIDLEAGGIRLTAADMTASRWRELCAKADRHDVAIRCSVTTLPLLLDETGRHIFCSGGNRASKTTTGLYWLALQYLRRGGYQRRFWLISITEKDCFELLEKMFRGTPSPSGGVVPPILPAALVESSPATHRASNLQTRTVDGALFDLIAFKNDPDAMRGKKHPIVAGVVDEAAALPSTAWLSTLRGRCVDFGGRLWFASTATPSSFLKAAVVDQVEQWERLPADDEVKLSGRHEGAAWLMAPLPMTSNPWIPLAEIEDAMRTLDMSKPENQRDFLGSWRSNHQHFWDDYFDPERHVYAHEQRSIETWSPGFFASVGAAGHVPITGMVRSRICSSPSRNPHHSTIRATNNKYLIGQDVNFGRMESVVVQVSAPPDKKNDPDAWHYWVVDTHTTVNSNTDVHAAELVSVKISKVYDPQGSTRTLDGCLVIMDPTHITLVDAHQRKHHQSGSPVDVFARHNLEVRGPLYRLSAGVWKKCILPKPEPFAVLRRLFTEGRLHIASRCNNLLEAFKTQLSDPDGRFPLDASKGHWDTVMGPVDALKYLTYAIANAKAPITARTLSGG